MTRPHNIFGWLFRPLCVTMAYGLRMDRLGASGGRYIVHNVHLCSNLAEIPNVNIIIIIIINLFWVGARHAACGGGGDIRLGLALAPAQDTPPSTPPKEQRKPKR